MPTKYIQKLKKKMGGGPFGLKKRFFGATPEFGNFFRKNKKDILFAYKKALNPKTTFPYVDRARKISISKKRTGKYMGGKEGHSFRFSIRGKKFFVRMRPLHRLDMNYKDVLEAHQKAEKALGANNVFNGFRFRVMMPHMFYERNRRSVVVSSFANERNHTLVYDMKDSVLKNRLEEAIKEAGNELRKAEVDEVLPANAFYDRRGGEVVLFDLEPTPAGEDL